MSTDGLSGIELSFVEVRVLLKIAAGERFDRAEEAVWRDLVSRLEDSTSLIDALMEASR